MSCCGGRESEGEQATLLEGERSGVTKNRKIVVAGYSGVGKSCVIVQFVENHFTQTYNPTIASTFSKSIKMRGQEFICEIVDTAGLDEFTPFPTSYGLGVHGYVLVYSVASKQSFERIPMLNDKVLQACGSETVPRILVGNKSDLLVERQVSTEEGRRLATEIGAAFIECSAKHNVCVADIFKQLLLEIEKYQGAPKTEVESSCAIL